MPFLGTDKGRLEGTGAVPSGKKPFTVQRLKLVNCETKVRQAEGAEDEHDESGRDSDENDE